LQVEFATPAPYLETKESMRQRAIIIGAGPAGLTAGLELLRRTGIQPILLEASEEIGGISRTIRYKGNRMDIGGHRFFSKSDRVMQWWLALMPPEEAAADQGPSGVTLKYQGKERVVTVPVGQTEEPPMRGLGPLSVAETDTDETVAEVELIEAALGQTATVVTQPPANPDLVMLIRPRKSRIYFLRRFFDYPIRLNGATLANLGPIRTVKIGYSYFISRFNQILPERTLQDFLINRFGRQLYLTFFKSYTEKVWGTPCETISADWGAQRIKGLSLTTAVKHFIKTKLRGGHAATDLAQRRTDTSLIERFLYPKLGPGQLWEHAAELIVQKGGTIEMGWKVDRVHCGANRVLWIESVNGSGERRRDEGDYFFSTMPMRELIACMTFEEGLPGVPADIRTISDGLQYRDFITVGLLVDKLKVHEPDGGLLKDTWIYIQEPEVLLGRLQIFNNWSPHLLVDQTKVWIGLEYFCYDTDPIWKMPDDELQRFAISEVEKIGILDAGAVSDSHVERVPKTYPAYFGTYERFDELRAYVDGFENLFLVGRNGMHKYNNQDHSMLTAMTAVDNILVGNFDKSPLWGINTEQDYHEEKKDAAK
jgi:protoporphyrinogen oxidase